MRLSQHSDYALRMLIHAGLRAPELTTVSEIAVDFGLSMSHLQKVAQTLAAHGYLETIRGRSGGIRLSRAPETIRIGRVVAVTEPDFQIAPCMTDHPTPEIEGCPIYNACTLRTALTRAKDAFLAELDTWTLADLIHKRKPLLVALQRAG